jgi:hypothetical protein
MPARDDDLLTRVMAFFRCVREGHDWRTSRSRAGYKTCMRCGIRQRIR